MNKDMPHEKLITYDKALSFLRLMAPVVESWASKYAIYDQIDRASESLIINLAKAAYNRHQDQSIYYIECSLGSALECAACLDIASIKQLIDCTTLHNAKESLQIVVRMEIGLRKARSSFAQEESPLYSINDSVYFSHESLQVYKSALQICQMLETNVLAPSEKWHRYARRIDEAITSLILNIAEGNGRFSRLDHGKFIALAEDAGITLAAYLDLINTTFSIDVSEVKSALRIVMAMLAGMQGYLHAKT